MAHEKLRPEYVFDEEKIAQLKQLAPECFEDGKINFTTLSQNLGDWRQDEEDPELEHFGLFWPGKRDARKAAAIPPEGTLEPVWGDGLKADGTPDTDGVNDSKNIFIEGENLEVLKLLQKSYAGKIKMIYIDPPYNTGNDFVYDDDFTEPLQEYLRRTGQVDEEGKAMTTNKRSDGRFHSKWLSMMYPRLRLARNLLREDGAIFVNIDDNEVHNLRALLNEIFGEENILSNPFIWDLPSGINAGHIARAHEYIMVYAKNKIQFPLFARDEFEISIERCNKKIDSRHPSSSLKVPAGIKYIGPDQILTGKIEGSEEITIHDELNFKDGILTKDAILSAGWTMKDMFQSWINGNEVIDLKGQKIVEFFFKENGKLYSKKELTTISPKSVLKNYGGSQDARNEIDFYLGSPDIFDYPKPVKLIRQLISYCIKENDIVLDFFAGSGTTAEACINEKHKEKNCKYILVQLPVQIEENNKDQEAAFKFCIDNQVDLKLSEITKQRIKRMALRHNNGFYKVYKLQNSNYKHWHNYQGTSISELELTFDEFNQSPLRKGYTEDGLLTEIILIEGFTLCSTISQLSEVQSNTIRKVTSEYCDHALLVCLDNQIAKATIVGLQLGENDIFICLDSAISTEDKLRLSDKGLIKTI